MRFFPRYKWLASKFLIFVIGIVSSFLIASPVSASEQFSTHVETTISVPDNGQPTIRKTFTITNKLSTVYITKYGIELSSPQITNISVFDANGQLPAEIETDKQSTTILITFPDKIVGRDKQRIFSIQYVDPNAVILSGEVIELYVPKVADPESFDYARTVIQVPSRYGQPTLATPETFTVSTVGQRTEVIFDNTGLREGISLLFGDRQHYDFKLKYNLYNPTGSRGITQITLPPDTSFQKVQYSNLEPKPDSVEADLDGNWIATYSLEANQDLVVTATGQVTTYLYPNPNFPIFPPQSQHSANDLFWESEDPYVQSIAAEHATPQEIYSYVVDTLSYNYGRLSTLNNRFGARLTLDQPSDAVCQEYTDVFIALARANQYSARQATGYALTTNQEIRPLSFAKDILHAWPEYYDQEKQLWIGVDPTWGSTTGGVDYFNHLDLNHIVFAYQGMTSNRPYPAGSYKKEDQDSKDIEIELAQAIPQLQLFDVDISVTSPATEWFLGLGTQTINVTNLTGQAWYDIPIEVNSEPGITVKISQSQLDRLLPYQTVHIPIEVTGDSWWRTSRTQLTTSIGEETDQLSVVAASGIQNLHLDRETSLYIGIAIASSLVMSLIVYGTIKLVSKLQLRKPVTEADPEQESE